MAFVIGLFQRAQATARRADSRLHGGPQRHRQGIVPRFAGSLQVAHLHCAEAGGLAPTRHFLVREAQPAMGVVGAQELQAVRREIHHQQPAVRTQQTCCLLERGRRIVEEVQHLVHGDHVGARRRQRHIVDVAAPHLAVGDAAGVQLGARDVQHLVALVDADTVAHSRSEHLEHAAGTGAEIHEVPDLTLASRLEHRAFDGGLADVEPADAVPGGGVVTEVGCRALGPLAAHAVESLQVARQLVIVRGQQFEQRPRHARALAALRQTVEHPGAFGQALEQAGVAQQLQVPAHPGLALMQHPGELGDRQLAARQHRQQPQPRRLGGRLEGSQQRFHDVRSGLLQ